MTDGNHESYTWPSYSVDYRASEGDWPESLGRIFGKAEPGIGGVPSVELPR